MQLVRPRRTERTDVPAITGRRERRRSCRRSAMTPRDVRRPPGGGPGRAGRLPARRLPDRRRLRSSCSTAMIDGGCDLVEVGLPFSDPVLDGPVIQHAAQTALAGGFRIRDLFGVVEAVTAAGGRAVVMTLLQPGAGLRGGRTSPATWPPPAAPGVITPDLIVDEAGPWLAAAAAHDLAPIFLVAPSSSAERIALTAAADQRVPLRRVDDGRHRRPRPGVGGRAGAGGPLPGDHRPADRRRARGAHRRPGRRDRRVRRRGDRRVGVRQRRRTRRRRTRSGELAAELAAGIRRAVRRPPAVTPAPRGQPGVTHYLRRHPVAPAGGLVRRAARRSAPTRSASSSASSSPSGGATSGSSPAAAGRAGSPTSRCSRCRSASSAAGSTTSSPTTSCTSARASNPWNAFAIWNGGLGHLGGDRVRRGRRLDRLPVLQGAAVRLRRLGRARHRRRAGHRPARQLLQPGAVRRARPRCRGGWRSSSAPRAGWPAASRLDGVCEFPTDYIKATPEVLCGVYQPTFLYEILWNLAVAARRGAGRPPVQARRRPGVRGLRRRLHAGPDLDRDAPDRPRQPHLRAADQRLHLGHRVPRRGAVPDPAPAPSAARIRRWSGARTGPARATRRPPRIRRREPTDDRHRAGDRPRRPTNPSHV